MQKAEERGRDKCHHNDCDYYTDNDVEVVVPDVLQAVLVHVQITVRGDVQLGVTGKVFDDVSASVTVIPCFCLTACP